MSFSDRSAVGATAGRGSSASAALPEQRSSTGADARFTALAAAAALPQAAWELPQPPAPAPSTAHRPAQNAFAAQPPGAWMLHGAHHPPPPVPSSSSSSFAMFAAPPPLAGSSAPSPHHRPAPPRPAPSPAQSVASFYSASPGSSVVRGPVTCQPCRGASTCSFPDADRSRLARRVQRDVAAVHALRQARSTGAMLRGAHRPQGSTAHSRGRRGIGRGDQAAQEVRGAQEAASQASAGQTRAQASALHPVRLHAR